MGDLVAIVFVFIVFSICLTVGLVALRRQRNAGMARRQGVTWKVEDESEVGVTHVVLRKVRETAEDGRYVLETREVGSVRDDDAEYDSKYTELVSKAKQRLAVLQP